MNDQLIKKIEGLRKGRDAVILAHNYQHGEVQDVADFTGDSLGLSIKASETDADVIVFCGVLFMAETAAILSPQKTVLLPEKSAGCPMADMIDAEQLRQVKAESDYCCTSANAVEVVESLPADRRIVFVPDRNLGQFVAERTGRDLVLWPGYCTTHVVITVDDIKKARAEHPDAIVMAHPECTAPVRKAADELLSTGQMLKFVAASDAKQFVVATETGIIHALKKQNPDAEFFGPTKRAICPNMKKITLDKVIASLEDMKHIIAVPDDITKKAKKALDRMVEILPAP